MEQALSDLAIIGCLNTNYGIEVTKLTLLPIGADMNAEVYKAQTLDQTAFFIKLKHGHNHDISVEVVELLKTAGVKEVIPPLKTVHGRPTQRIGDFTLIVYPFIEGQDGFSRNLTDDQWAELGKALRQVHEIAVPLSIQKEIRRESYSPKWRETVRSLYVHIEAEPISDSTGLKLRKFLKENMLTIRQLVDGAEQLGHKSQEQSSKFVLCHSDIHAGNVLIDGHNRIYIVDWDEPIMAPKERDLMFFCGGVGNVWNNPDDEKLFYKGYGMTEINMTILAYYRYERIVEDIAVYARELLMTKGDETERVEMYRQFVDLFKPRGVVDIAFKTGETLGI